MPGSTLNSVLQYPYLTRWSYSSTSGSWANSTNNIFTVPSHPFVTGDVIYVALYNNNQNLVTSVRKYYAIVLSPTTLQYANTYNDAMLGIALPIPVLSTTVLSSIENIPPVGAYAILYNAGFYDPNTWNSSSWSNVSFNSSQNVRIDLTLSNENYQMAAIRTKSASTSSSYVCGFCQTNYFQSIVGEAIGTNSYTFGNMVQNIQQALPATIRFSLENKRVSIAIKMNNGTYFTRFTGSIIADNTPPLFLGVGMGLNALNVNNCTITYL